MTFELRNSKIRILLFLHPSSFILHPSSFILHPSSFILHPSSFILHPSSFILHPSSFKTASSAADVVGRHRSRDHHPARSVPACGTSRRTSGRSGRRRSPRRGR